MRCTALSLNAPSMSATSEKSTNLCACCQHAGFQTHTTPVLLNAGERAELATEQYIPLSPLLEGFVILRPNPDYVEPKT